LEDERHSDVISWSASDDSFIVKDQGRFSRSILPMYFKHSNFASFVRQLNKYDFHKVKRTSNEYITAYGEQIWEFRHPLFLRRRYDLLESIRRKCVTKTRAKSDSATPGPDTDKAEASITTGDAPENAQQVSELFNQIAELRTQLKEVTRMERQNALNVQKYARSYAQLKTEMDMVHDQIHQRDRIISQLIQCLASQDMLNKDIGAHAAPSQLLSSYVKLMRQDTSRTTPSDHLASPTSRPKMEDPGMVFSTGASASQQLSSSSALSVPGSENQTGAPVSVATTSSVACSVPNPHASSQSHPSFMAPFQSISPSLIPCRQSELTQSVKLLGQYVNNMPAMPVSSAASSDAPTTTAVTTDSTSPALSFTSTITVVPSNIPSPSSSPSVTATGAAPNGSHSRQDYFCDAAKGLAFTWMQPPRVLLVEDAAVSQLTTKHMLQSLGCVFDEVADDVAAINKLNTSKYDLVLMVSNLCADSEIANNQPATIRTFLYLNWTAWV
jgi:osomolarity two-component system response regulator SKN7